MGDADEYTVLLHLTSKLEQEFEGDTDLAHYLHEQGYIKDNDYSDIIDPKSLLSRRDKSSLLVSGVRQKVALYPRKYHDIVDYLRLNSRKYGDIVNLLDIKLGDVRSLKHHVQQSNGANSLWRRAIVAAMIFFLVILLLTATMWAYTNLANYSKFFIFLLSFISNSQDPPEPSSTSCSKDTCETGKVEIDLSKIKPTLLTTRLQKHNIVILEHEGLNERTGYWWLHFTFDYQLENGIEVRLTNFKHGGDNRDWTLEITRCIYLGIHSKHELVSFDMADEFINASELSKIVGSDEDLLDYLEQYIVPLVTRKIKYCKYKPQFKFFLSHMSKDTPLMRTFENGLKFLGYDSWLKDSVNPFGNILGVTKAAIDQSDCFLPWIDERYMKDIDCRGELLYAHKSNKIILPFGDRDKVRKYFTGEFEFMNSIYMFNPDRHSFFEVLEHIDETLYNFEKLVL